MPDSKPTNSCEFREGGVGRRAVDQQASKWQTWGAGALAAIYTAAMLCLGAVVGTRTLIDQLDQMDIRASADLLNQTNSFNLERQSWSNEKETLRAFLKEKNVTIAGKDEELKRKDAAYVDLVAKFAALGGKMGDLATSAAKASESSSEAAKILAPKQE